MHDLVTMHSFYANSAQTAFPVDAILTFKCLFHVSFIRGVSDDTVLYWVQTKACLCASAD